MASTNLNSARATVVGIIAITTVVVVSNILVRYPINDWLTWGALSFPVAFLVTDLVNRHFGPKKARQIAYAGFACAVVLSYFLSTPRIALASGTAFIVGQLADIFIFHRLRQLRWWKAPLISSGIASTVDTALFFSIAFAGTGLPWITWGIGDLGVKLAVAITMLLPFYAMMGRNSKAAVET